jgi:hypothetical protein
MDGAVLQSRINQEYGQISSRRGEGKVGGWMGRMPTLQRRIITREEQRDNRWDAEKQILVKGDPPMGV